MKLWDQLPGGADHRATVRYEPAMRMVYVHLDGALALWAPLTAADVAPLETGAGAWAGFVGAAGTSVKDGMAVSVGEWALGATATDGARGRLLESGLLIGEAGAGGLAVHIDARDGCGARPRRRRGVGGDAETAGRRGAGGARMSDRACTYRVALDPPPHAAGEYEVTATLKAGARPGSFAATFLLGEPT